MTMRGECCATIHTGSIPSLGGHEGNGAPGAIWGNQARRWTYFINGRALVTVATPTAALGLIPATGGDIPKAGQASYDSIGCASPLSPLLPVSLT